MSAARWGCLGRAQEALESKGSLDDSQWLTYWILMAFMTLAERSLVAVVRRVPLYAEGKLLLLAFLALPPLNGAELLYFQVRGARASLSLAAPLARQSPKCGRR